MTRKIDKYHIIAFIDDEEIIYESHNEIEDVMYVYDKYAKCHKLRTDIEIMNKDTFLLNLKRESGLTYSTNSDVIPSIKHPFKFIRQRSNITVLNVDYIHIVEKYKSHPYTTHIKNEIYKRVMRSVKINQLI